MTASHIQSTLRQWCYFAGKWTIIVFQFAVKWCRIKTTFQFILMNDYSPYTEDKYEDAIYI